MTDSVSVGTPGVPLGRVGDVLAAGRAAPAIVTPGTGGSCATTTSPSPTHSSPTPQPSTSYGCRVTRIELDSTIGRDERTGHLQTAGTRERARQELRAGNARARRAARPAGTDGAGAALGADGDRRQGDLHGRELPGGDAAPQGSRPRRRRQGRARARAAGDRRCPQGAHRVVAPALGGARV